MSSSFRNFCFALLALLAFVGLAQASAGDAGSNGLIWSIPGSPIELTRVYSYWWSDYEVATHSQGPMYFNDCVEFRNQSNKPVRSFQVIFASIYPDGHSNGSAMPLDIHTTVAPGQKITGLNCRDHAYANGAGGRWLVGWVSSVRFIDGSSWHAAPSVEGSVDNGASAPATLGTPEAYLPLEECDGMTNTSEKTITHVQLVFHHIGIDGTDLGDDALDVRESIAPGETVKNSCRGFNGYSDPDVSYYAHALASGELTLPSVRIFYNGKEAKLLVTVNIVDFADGTSWRAQSI